VRAPFMDHVLIDAIRRVPLHERLDLVQSKPILRKLLASRVPEAIWSRVKRGFTPPGQFIQHTVLTHMEQTLESPIVRRHFAVDDVRRAFQEVESQPKWRWFLFILASSALSHAHWRAAT
jgi:asparagine synthetase B (glutamine-hydrolysing)